MAREKKWVLFIVVVLLTIVGYAAVNKYWFYPNYTARINPPAHYVSPGEKVSVTPFEITKFAETLHHIKDPNASLPAATVAEDDNRQCPFLWKDERKITDPPPPPPQEKPVEIPKLGMILIGESDKLAMLDKTLVQQGEVYNRHRVEEITPGYVMLSGKYGVIKIHVPVKSFGAPTVEIVEVTDPDMLIKPVVHGQKKE